MKKYFYDAKTNELFHFWMSNSPESYHQLDMERFFAFVLNLFNTGEELNENILTSAVKDEKKWIDELVDEFVDSFMTKYVDLKQFWDYYTKTR